VPRDTWTWVPFPDAICADGSSSGIGLRTSPTGSEDLLVFLDGGGACWDYLTCVVLESVLVSRRHFGEPDLQARLGDVPGSILDRNTLPPGLAEANLVFVPYCTADVHGGDRRTTYSDPTGLGPSATFEHRGHANVLAYLKRLGATFPSAGAVVLAGSSAGGFGAVVNYDAFRAYWPGARGVLLDDSGPALVGNDVPPQSHAAWYSNWDLGEALDPVCPTCKQDLSAAYTDLALRHPFDRIALLSYTEDAVIRGFYFQLPSGPMPPSQFHAALNRLATTVLAPIPSARYFFEDGSLDTPARPPTTHTMLGKIATHAAGTAAAPVPLASWLAALLAGESPAASVRPP
jgi:hypothetical protein